MHYPLPQNYKRTDIYITRMFAFIELGNWNEQCFLQIMIFIEQFQ